MWKDTQYTVVVAVEGNNVWLKVLRGMPEMKFNFIKQIMFLLFFFFIYNCVI